MRNRTENQIILVFIRHGKTKSNEEGRYLGKEDEPLSEKGRNELRLKSGEGFYPPVDLLFTSPMKRCLETAELLYPDKRTRIISRWTEIDFGFFSGKNYEELKDSQDYQKWLDSKGALPFPGGESREEFGIRCEEGFQEMMKQVEELKESRKESWKGTPLRVGIVVHGGTIMALLCRYGGGDYFDYQLKNGEVYVVKARVEGQPPVWEIEKR